MLIVFFIITKFWRYIFLRFFRKFYKKVLELKSELIFIDSRVYECKLTVIKTKTKLKNFIFSSNTYILSNTVIHLSSKRSIFINIYSYSKIGIKSRLFSIINGDFNINLKNPYIFKKLFPKQEFYFVYKNCRI